MQQPHSVRMDGPLVVGPSDVPLPAKTTTCCICNEDSKNALRSVLAAWAASSSRFFSAGSAPESMVGRSRFHSTVSGPKNIGSARVEIGVGAADLPMLLAQEIRYPATSGIGSASPISKQSIR